jgi:cytochrome c2
MKSMTVGVGFTVALLGAAGAWAEGDDVAGGLALYNKECAVCHGVMTHDKTGLRLPVGRPHAVQVAMTTSGATTADVRSPLSSDLLDAGAVRDLSPHRPVMRDHLAVVPIYGPPLQNVIGRTAATFKGYTYSKSFTEKMTGVVWDEAKVDKWLTSSQTMVPGSYMFYSMKKSEDRRKIIEYLKTQTE